MLEAIRKRWQRFLEQSALIREYLWKYRKPISIGLVVLLIIDLVEVIPPLILMNVVDGLTQNSDHATLLQMAFIILAVTGVQAVGRYGWRFFLIRSSVLSGRDIRDRFTHHLFGLSASFFDKRRIGELMSLATTDVEAIRMVIGAGLLVFADACFYLCTIPIVMIYLSPELALLAFLPLPFIPWIVARNQKEIHKRFERVQESFATLSAMGQESLNGIRVTKVFAREDAQLNRFKTAGDRHVALAMHLSRVQSSFGPSLDFMMSLGLVILLYFGGSRVLEGAVTLGTFVAFQRFIQKMVWPMAALGMAFSYYQRAVASSQRIGEILEHKSDTPTPPVGTLPIGYQGRARGKVEFRNLSFSFPGSSKRILHGISLVIDPGERVAFLGAVGAGKSALLSLLPRVYPVADGMLFVDGVDVNHWPIDELRKQVGYVGQDVFLFSDSVIENVGYGLKENLIDIGNPSIKDATRLAAIHDEVMEFRDAYGTRLGERGVSLSGGQKQRLTIARAAATQPAILVLDDALSAVDVQTEENILKGLRSRSERNTEIIAAHRISTIRDADRIIVLEQGTIRQQGTHLALLKDKRGLYRIYFEQQQLKEDLESYLEKSHE